MDTITLIYQSDQEYRPVYFEAIKAVAAHVKAVAIATAVRDMGEVEHYLELMQQERPLLVARHEAELKVHEAAMAAIQRWLGARAPLKS